MISIISEGKPLTLESKVASSPAFLIVLLFKNDFNLLMCFHSHIMGDENFSEFDIKMSENSCIPFMVYSLNTQKFNIYSPKTSESDVSIINRFKDKL